MNTTFDKSSRQALSGAVWLILGLLALVLSIGIKKPGFANNQDPGPQFFPILLGGLMTTGGIFLVTTGFYSKWKRQGRVAVQEVEPHCGWNKMLLLFMGGFAVYVSMIPWTGFTLASTLYGFLLLWLQGSRWYVSLVIILILMIGIKLLFGSMFHVQLPEGVIGFPF